MMVDQPSQAKFKELCTLFKSMRKVRGDGNCFYRAFCFAHLESLLQNDRALQRFKDKVIESGKDLRSAGFDESAFNHLLTTFLHVVDQCKAACNDREETLYRVFNETTTSNSIVQYLRLLTSAHLQNNADFFKNFVESTNLRVYCTQEVEAMAMECDHVDILALSEALGVSLHIVSMEGEDRQLAHHTIPEGAQASMHLLYKTAHYDILYPYAQQ